MSDQLAISKKKLEEMKARRQNRLAGLTSEVSEPQRSEIKLEKKEYSLQKSEHIHVAGALVETYDMEIQCALETRSLDSRPAKDREEQEKEIDLLLPREQHKHRRRDNLKEQQPKQVHELSNDELNSVIKSRTFNDFFNKSSKFLEKVLDHGDGDMIQAILREGFKTKQRSGQDILAHSVTFSDPNFTNNRVVTDLDWSPQINQLFLASYSENEQGSIKDHVGVVLLWNPSLKNRAQFYCFSQSAVTSAKFYPFSNSAVLGGCYNGQLLLWDLRAKSTPVQRSGISAQGHKYPICSLNIVGTQIANNIVSFSNDGMMCMWDIKQFSKPTRTNKISANRSQRAQAIKPTALNTTLGANRSLKPETSMSNTSSILQRTNKEETHDINISCCKFPVGDANNYYIGSLNGVLYKNTLHNKGNQKVAMLDEHNGPISSVSINYPSEFELLNNLVLTSSYDWTVKLWHPDSKDSLRTFQNSQDYIYDAAWHPNNPSLFATVNNDGYLDIFDLTRDLELPVAHEKVSKNAQNRCIWNNDGSAIISGDSSGTISLFGLADKYRKMENSKYEDLERYLRQKPESD